MASLFPSSESSAVPISAHSAHFARRFHELLVPLESLVTEWNGAVAQQRSLGEETISNLNDQGYYSSTRFAVIHSLIWYMEEQQKLKVTDQFAVFPTIPRDMNLNFTSSPTEYARRPLVTPPSSNSALGGLDPRSSQAPPPRPQPSPGFGFYQDQDSVMAPARSKSRSTKAGRSMGSEFGASTGGVAEDVKPDVRAQAIAGDLQWRNFSPPTPPINTSFPSSGLSLPFIPHGSQLHPSANKLPPSDIELNQDDVYILIDRSPSTPIKRDAPAVIRELTLSAKELKPSSEGRLEPHLKLNLARPTALDARLPSSFTTFEATEHPNSPILQLSPPSQHLLIFHFPPRSFTPTPKVDFGSGHWWRNQVCRGVHPMASNGDWTGRHDPPTKLRRRNRVLHHFETCQLGQVAPALRDFAKVLRIAEGGK